MRVILTTIFYAALIFPLAACQAETEEPAYEAGTHYEVLPQPVPTTVPGKVEVVEVFWYGCSHCYTFESLAKDWKENLPEHAEFVQMPAIWSSVMELHAKAYYTAKALKVLDKVHMPIFEAMNLKKQKLSSEKEIAELFVANGVAAEKFSKVFNSWGVGQQMKLNMSRQKGYRTQGTPELVVNGKYRISARQTGSQANMLKVADYLIAKESQAATP